MKVGDEIIYKNQIWTVFHIYPKISDNQPILIGKDKKYLTVDKSELKNSKTKKLKQYYAKPASTMTEKQRKAIKLCEEYGAPTFNGKLMGDVNAYLNTYLDDAKAKALNDQLQDAMHDACVDPYGEAGFN